MDYANTNNVRFIVHPKLFFHGWFIYSYLQIFQLQIGSLTILWHDHACIDDTSYPDGKKINEHVLNREPVPLSFCYPENLSLIFEIFQYEELPYCPESIF